jgi:DNA topoisomerase-2
MSKKIEEIYQKKDLRQHILDRPDTYIGSTKSITEELYIYDSEEDMMSKRVITYVPGLYKIFDEILVNATDHSANCHEVTNIKVTIEEDTGLITVFNDGEGIPVVLHSEHKIYVPELIFGNLLTSSNYDDNDQRVTGGRNGFGAKLANIYSNSFEIETVDSTRKKKYIQKFTKNMTEKGKPKITTVKSSKSYTKITFEPDLSKFGLEKLDKDNISIMEKRVFDSSACTRSNVNVYLNGKMLKHKTFEKYADLYIGGKKDKKRVYESNEDKTWEVVATLNEEDKLQQVSFVNGIWTIQGGKHVDYIQNQIARKLTEYIQNKKKKLTLKPGYIKDKLFLFLKSTVVNPSFSSQTKEILTTNTKDFGYKYEVSDKFIENLSKCGIMEEVIALAEHRENRELAKKTDGNKRTRIKVEKLDDANWAGTKRSEECTLILTEGDSAKTFAVSGLSVIGRDKYGVFPLRGKLLNVRDASTKKILENKEINQLKQILGLQHDRVYNDMTELRYGKIMILTDADHDGSHIKGLIMNLFHNWWPSLMKTDKFITSMRTPIVKAMKGKNVKEFHTMTDYNEWKGNNNINGWRIKYYKGLGTSDPSEAREYFRNLNVNMVTYSWVNKKTTDNAIKLAFEKKQADNRKIWLSNYNTNNIIETTDNIIPYKDFVDKELIHFSINDLMRSIPSVCDGLKPSQRKVLHTSFKVNLTNETKVIQLSGEVMKHAAYHHGDMSLTGTIVGMAQDFIGSNNINLLTPVGQFGSRLLGGKDHASPRYISTHLNPVTRVIFNKADNALLEYMEDDGIQIEPKWFLPILPMVLVNGAEGIGTGYSTFIPCYNPKDIMKNIERLMDSEPMQPITPWYKGFKGRIEEVKPGSYISYGVYEKINDKKIKITELPVGRWTNDYKEFLDSDNMDKIIKDYNNYNTEDSVNFMVEFSDKNKLQQLIESGDIYTVMKLTKSFSINNMHLFNNWGVITKYNDPLDIIQEFYNVRMEYYEKRKDHQLNELQRQLQLTSNKMRFLNDIMEEKIVVFRKSKSEIENQLKERKFDELGDVPSYKYLIDMPIYTFSEEKLKELTNMKDRYENEYKELEETIEEDMWLVDMNNYIKKV